MKKLILLIVILACFFVISPKLAHAASELEVWCVAEGQNWDPVISTCFVGGEATVPSSRGLTVLLGEIITGGKMALTAAIYSRDTIDNYDIIAGSEGWVQTVDPDDDQTQIDGQVLTPYITAAPSNDWISGEEWPVDAIVTIEIDDPNTPQDPDFSTAQIATEDGWRPGQLGGNFQYWSEYDFSPGDAITLSDGLNTKSLVVSDVQITAIDVENDVITGVTDSNRNMWVFVHGENGAMKEIQSDPSGTWSADFTGDYDIQLGTEGSLKVFDDDEDMTHADWQLTSLYPPGMVSYWKFDEDSGTIAYDSVNDYDGIITGATWAEGIAGNALSFDGVNDYVAFSTHEFVNTSDSFSYSIWIKFNNDIIGSCSGPTYEYDQMIVSIHDGPYLYLGTSGRMIAMVRKPDYSFMILKTNRCSWSGDVWYHIAVTLDSSKMKIYLDGSLENEIPGGLKKQSGDSFFLKLGRMHYLEDYYLNGTVDELAVFDRALFADEIQQHFQNGLNGLGYEITSPANQAPVADAGGPYYGAESSAISFAGATASDLNDDMLSYSWSIDSNLCSFVDDLVLNPSVACDDNGVFVATLSVSDGVNDPVSSETQVSVSNADPIITEVINNGPILVGDTAFISVVATDPAGAYDPLLYAFDCDNDNIFEIGAQVDSTSICTFQVSGDQQVNVQVTDDDEGSVTGAAVVEVQTPQEATEDLIDDVQEQVDDGILENGNGLITTLEKVTATLDKGRTNVACNQLGAFINQVNGFITAGKLTAEEGQLLIDSANHIYSAIGC